MSGFLSKLFGRGGVTVKGKGKVVPTTGDDAVMSTELGQLVTTIDAEMADAREYPHKPLKPSESATYKNVTKDKDRAADLARFLFKHRKQIMAPLPGRSDWDRATWRGFPIFTALMRTSLPLPPAELLTWAAELKQECDDRANIYDKKRHIYLREWPVAYMIQAVERQAKKTPLTGEVLDQLSTMLVWKEMNGDRYSGTDFSKVRHRIETLIGATEGVDLQVQPYRKLSGDFFGDALEADLNALAPDEAEKWNRVFNLAATASGGKPTKAFKGLAQTLKTDLGKEWLRSHVQDWIDRAIRAKVTEGTYHQVVFSSSNVILLKGLVWICDGFQDARTINLIADLCEKSMRKIPGVGPAAQATANACLWYLETTPGAEATARLSRLTTAIKQKSVQKKVAAIVAKKAEAAGITTIQLEERVVPTYRLTQGTKDIAFDDYALRLSIDGPGKVGQSWIKPDGSRQKTKPKFIAEKAALKEKLDKTRAEVTAIKKVLTAQRDRIDRLFAEDVEWPLAEVETHYVGHDLLAPIAGRLIWDLTSATGRTGALWRDGGWQDVTGAAVPTDDTTTARLWHPIDWETDQVMAWRARLAALDIVQPTKQAYREVYLLTDAERTTRVYSNRMAAHMLKQHQMATLMAARGWRYQLMGAYDDGLDDQWAKKTFVTSDLSAEYLLHTNWDGDNFNDAGIYLYVGTDQLRFSRDDTPVPLDEVPPRLLSETLREADLFVGVASVGNDPAWADQGPTPEARTYWQSYSFGTLDGFAETRKQVLDTLLPRLKIRDVAHMDGKFLIVDGRLNTYKIHLGSSNILMAPGDRYLCIVPGGLSKAGQVALPFEGDTRLSVILSKALMLAEDDKITAPDIVSQLQR